MRSPASNFDKLALRDDLKLAGFEDCIAETIAARVDDKKADQWTHDMGRQEAIKEAYRLLADSHTALDTFRSSTLSTTGQRDRGPQTERPLAERIADTF